MSLALLDTIILREVVDSPYTTKGSELTFAELDTNIIILADAVREASQVEVSGIEPYDPGEEYSNSAPDYVTYASNTWVYINAIPSTGVTPGTDPTTWELASSGVFSHQQNTDTYLALGTSDEVTAAEIRAFIDSGPYDDSQVVYLDGSREMEADLTFANNLEGLVFENGMYIRGDGGSRISLGEGFLNIQNAPGGTFMTWWDTANSMYRASQDIAVDFGWVFNTWVSGTPTTKIKLGNGATDPTEFFTAINGTSLVLSSTITAFSDADSTHILGRAKIGSPTTDEATFAHFDHLSTTNYCIKQTAAANTQVNAAAGQAITFRTNNVTRATVNGSALTLASGINLVLGNAATTGLSAGALAATTNASIVIHDSTGQAYRIPCII